MTVTEDVLTVVDAFDTALKTRDRDAAEAIWALDRDDVSVLGSAAGEEFIGPQAVRSCLAALTSRQTAHGWRWAERRLSVLDDVAWLIADAPWQTVQPNGDTSERPYRVTGVLIRKVTDGNGVSTTARSRSVRSAKPVGTQQLSL